MIRAPIAIRASVTLFVLAAPPVLAAIPGDGAGLLNDVTEKFLNQSSIWGATITFYASWLFWVLATISMVWTFGLMALRRADIGEFFSEFVRFTITTGLFWWFLTNGPAMAMAVINSLRKIGAQAGGLPNLLTPSTPITIAFSITKKAFAGLSWVHPIDNLAVVLVTTAIVICMAIIAANVLIALVTAWSMAYAGAFILGFGGARWTSDMAVGYFKAVLAIGLELMTMTLLVGIATSVIDGFYRELDGSSIYELLLVLCVACVLAILINKIPGRVAALAGSAGSGAGVGVSSVMGGAAMAGAALATGGAALVAGATGMAGGAQALMAAFSKAHAAESANGGSSALLGPVAGSSLDTRGGDSSGGSALAAAMGDAGSSGNAFMGTGSGSKGGFSLPSDSSNAAGSGGEDSGGGQNSGYLSGPSQSRTGSDETEAGLAEVPRTVENTQASSSSNNGDGGANSAGLDTGADASAQAKGAAADTGTAGPKQASALTAIGKAAAKVGKVAAGTAINLAQGSWDVAKGAMGDVKQSFKDRIAETTGGKIAAAIMSREAQSEPGTGNAVGFGKNSLAAAASEPLDAEAEVAAFRDRNPPLHDY